MLDIMSGTITVKRWVHRTTVAIPIYGSIGFVFDVTYIWPRMVKIPVHNEPVKVEHHVDEDGHVTETARRPDEIYTDAAGVLRVRRGSRILSPETRLALYEASVRGESQYTFTGRLKRWLADCRPAPDHETGVAHGVAVVRSGGAQ